MAIIGSVVLGIIIFFVLVFAVIIGGAFGNKQERHLRELTESQQAAGITGDVTMGDRQDDRTVPA